MEKGNLTNADALLSDIVEAVTPIDFMVEAYPEAKELQKRLDTCTDDKEREYLSSRLSKFTMPKEAQKYVIIVDKLVSIVEGMGLGLCRRFEFAYIYNGVYWMELEKRCLESFLGEAAEKMGLNHLDAKRYSVREMLRKQFMTKSLKSNFSEVSEIKINLLNGTYVISGSDRELRDYDSADFMQYVLPFNFDPSAKAPMFEAFLNQMLPDQQCQKVLAEFIGWLFIPKLKLEKALILHGSGANGKSVFFEVISALLGKENMCSFSLGKLCDANGYYRAKMTGKLLNYSSEIGSKGVDEEMAKKMISGEPIECRLPYGEPFMLDDYPKMIFNANSLPKNTDQSHAYFRRFIIIPFSVTIPEYMQDKTLAQKIIQSELSGIFNWVLAGLDRLIENQSFSESEVISRAVSSYKDESDTVKMFLMDEGYTPSSTQNTPLDALFKQYVEYCQENNSRDVGKRAFSQRCKDAGYKVDRVSAGMRVWAERVM